MSESSKETKREPFKIVINEPIAKFNPIAQSKYITSNEFCKLTSELFKEVFADWEGCIFEVSGNVPSLSFIFNHGQYSENDITCCERKNGKVSGSSVIDRTRYRDRQLQEGDRYYITEDGKDAITSLLVSNMYNNGNPNWKMIVSDFIDNSIMNRTIGGIRTQYTKVSFIDLSRVCRLLFGKKVDNDDVDYSVVILSALVPNYQMMNNVQMNSNYMLNITRAYSNEVRAAYEKLGFGNVMGTTIIR